MWKVEPSGQYSVKYAYQALTENIAAEDLDGALKELWKLNLPSKIVSFAWRLLKDRLPTRENLQRRQIQVHDPWCPFCRSAEESAGHLFFHCRMILLVWWELLSWVNLVGVFPQNPRQHFLQHIHGTTEDMRVKRWKWWWLALTQTIWKQRNTIIFSNGSFNANRILDDAVFLLWTWLSNLEKDFSIHYNHWSSNISVGFLNSEGLQMRINMYSNFP